MKKFSLWAALFLLLAGLCACGQQPNQTAENTPAPLPEGTAWVKYFNTWLPVSVVADGEQFLQTPLITRDGTPWYFEVYELLGLPQDYHGEELLQPLRLPATAVITVSTWHNYAVKDMLAPGSQTPLDIADDGWLDDYVWGDDSTLFGGVALSGDWEPFPTPVRFEAYTPEKQPQDLPGEERIMEILQSLAEENNADVPPLLAKCGYYFDIDGDGREEALLNFGNLCNMQADAPNPPAAANPLIYSMTVYVSGSGEVLTMDSFGFTVEQQPLFMDMNDSNNDIYYSYLPPKQADDWYEQYCAAYQYDAADGIAPSPIYNCGEFDPAGEMHMVLADIDGDGQAEMLTCMHTIYYPLSVYKFDGDMPVSQFEVITPA